MRIKFKKAGRRTRSCAHIDIDRQEIVLRTPLRCQECDSYIKLLNHEFLHETVDRIAGWETCKKLDNIAEKLSNYLPDVYC